MMLKEILDALARVSGLPAPRVKIPYALAYAAGWCSTAWAGWTGNPPGIPLEHGLPGSTEVEVERVSPALLVLRAAGQFLGTSRPVRPGESDRGQP